MKVLIIGHTYCAAINREKWRTFARMFPNFKLVVVVPQRWSHTLFELDATAAADDNLPNCRFIPLATKHAGNEGRYRFYWRDLRMILRRERPSIIQVEQGVGAFVLLQVQLLQKLLRLPAQVVFFTWINWEPVCAWSYYLYRYWIEQITMRYSHAAVVGNSGAAKLLQKRAFAGDIAIIPQIGVDDAYGKTAMPSQARSKKTIGYVGRMLKKKGLFYLIDAFTQLAPNYPEWKLLLVGAGNDKDELVSYVKKISYADQILFHDAIPHKQVYTFLAQLDIFVLPSYDTKEWKEQFGHVLIEAMVAGAPIVGSSGGAIPEVVGDAGLIVAQRDSQRLAQALQALMGDSQLRDSYRDKGRIRVKKQFTHEAIATQLYTFWQQNKRESAYD